VHIVSVQELLVVFHKGMLKGFDNSCEWMLLRLDMLRDDFKLE